MPMLFPPANPRFNSLLMKIISGYFCEITDGSFVGDPLSTTIISMGW
jgi:hypothetical protein